MARITEIGDEQQLKLITVSIYFAGDQIAIRQSQVDKLYASLKDLSLERRSRLEETLKLYMLNREIENLEQWIAEKEAIASSHELGQDFEHVSMLQDR